MAHAGGGDADEHLPLMGLVELQGLDRERSPDLAQYGGSSLNAESLMQGVQGRA